MNDCMPVILCNDVEPDLQRSDPNKADRWWGFERLFSYLQELHFRRADTTGETARLNWLVLQAR